MALGNFVKGVIAQVIPGGATYGSYNPPKKKKNEEQTQTRRSAPSGGNRTVTSPSYNSSNPGNVADNQAKQIKTQRPENLFAGLNNNLSMPGAPKNTTTVNPNASLDPVLKPQPGTIVKPNSNPKSVYQQTKPKPEVVKPRDNSVWGKAKRAASIAKNTAVGTVASLPELGLAGARTATGIVQGVTEIPHIVTAATAGASKIANEIDDNKFTRSLNKVAQKTNTTTKNITNVVNKPFNFVNRNLDKAAEGYENLVPIAGGGAEAYRTTQIPLNVLAGLATFGGTTAAGTASKSSNIAKISEALNKPLTKNLDNAISKTSRAVTSRTAPVVRALNAPISSATQGVTRYIGNNRNLVNAERDLVDEGLSANILNTSAELPPIESPRPITVNAPTIESTPVPVTVSPRPVGEPIRDLAGDAPGAITMPTPQEVAAQRATNQFETQVPGRPDRSIEGIETNPAKIITRADKEDAQAVLDDYLQTGRISEENHASLSNELSKTPAADDVVPQVRKIEVKEVDPIPVRDETNVPIDMPETPGQVRVTDQSSPNNSRSTELAAQTPAPLPRAEGEVGAPRQLNSRQVASTRNQRKLARQMAKAQEDTAEALSRVDNTKTTPQSENFAPTGEVARGKKGNTYEKANASAEKRLGEQEMSTRSVEDLASEIGQKKSLDAGDARRISAAKQNLLDADPEGARGSEMYKLLDRAEKANRTRAAQIMALIPRTVRKTASSDTLTGRWDNKIRKVLDDPTKITSQDMATVQKANDKFTLARDNASRLEEQWKKSGSDVDYKAWEKAFNDARTADTGAKLSEVQAAQRVLKGQRGANVTKTLDELKKEANVNSMDIVSANMLSGTATGFRNTVGAEIAGLENRIGANVRAKVTNSLFKENVGGFDRKGARLGRKVGLVKTFSDAKRRAEVGGKNPLEWAKNWATTINSGGESSLQSQIYSRLGKYYKNKFDTEGLSKQQIDQRMRHAMLTDPDEMADVFTDGVMKSSGLTGLFEKGQTIEKAVTDYIGRQTDSKTLQTASKLAMRLAVGFPTATTNFLYQSGKRLTGGLPSFIEVGAKLSRGDKTGAAQAFDRGLKELGSGGAILGLGAALGSANLISGSYPSDPAERERWTREGISENSINIGGNWYPIPQGAGMLGLPLLTGAAIGREGADGIKNMYNPKNLSKLLPTDQLQGFLNMASGDGAPQDLKNFVASTVRAATPVGALLNQISKSFDETKNDTTTKGFWENVLDQVGSGIPGLNNAMNIPDKLDADGNPIKNPGALPLAFGAASTTQGGGVQRTAELQGEVDSQLSGLQSLGILGNSELDGVLEGNAKEAYKKMQNGQNLNADEVKDIKEGFVKGVSSEGTDTAYLERGQYDTNLAVLKLKRDLMDDDKTVKPSSLKDIDTAIKRGEVYKEIKVPYDLIDAYKSTGVDAWRKMGDPESDEYDPDMYQKLYDVDSALTKAGVSYKKGALDENKYFAKAPGKGKSGGSGGGGGGGSFSADFGTLKAGTGAPTVQQYQSIDKVSGSVPVIRKERPNIVHKISTNG